LKGISPQQYAKAIEFCGQNEEVCLKSEVHVGHITCESIFIIGTRAWRAVFAAPVKCGAVSLPKSARIATGLPSKVADIA
jgi:hypothetical protein